MCACLLRFFLSTHFSGIAFDFVPLNLSPFLVYIPIISHIFCNNSLIFQFIKNFTYVAEIQFQFFFDIWCKNIVMILTIFGNLLFLLFSRNVSDEYFSFHTAVIIIVKISSSCNQINGTIIVHLIIFFIWRYGNNTIGQSISSIRGSISAEMSLK